MSVIEVGAVRCSWPMPVSVSTTVEPQCQNIAGWQGSAQLPGPKKSAEGLTEGDYCEEHRSQRCLPIVEQWAVQLYRRTYREYNGGDPDQVKIVVEVWPFLNVRSEENTSELQSQ